MKQSTPERLVAAIEKTAAHWILRRDAGLTGAEAAEFEHWQAADPQHAEAVARKANAWRALDRPRQSGQADLLLERLDARAAARRRRRRQIVAGAAGIIVLLAAMISMPRKPAEAPPAARSAVLLPETRTLPDGSVVELKAGAEVEVDFAGTFRRVRLKKGEAHFQVAKNEARPFIVTSGTVAFRAVGTAFSVRFDPSEVELLVTEGRVAVQDSVALNAESARPREGVAPIPESPKTDLPPPRAAPLEVPAGNRVVVELADEKAAVVLAPTAVTADEMAERLAWRAPKLEFSELPLEEAVALINRHNKVHFQIGDPALAQLRISGLFRADNIDTFVRLLEGTCGIEANRSGDLIVLRKAR